MNHRPFVRAVAVGLVGTLYVGDAEAQSTAGAARHGDAPSIVAIDSGAAWGAHSSPPSACERALTGAEMTSQSVYLDSRMALYTERPITAQAELIAHDVAAELRTQLGGSDSIVPDIGRSLPWFALPAELVLVARPNGEMTWRGYSESGDSAAITVLARALDSARHRGLALMRWPERYVADSLVVRLTLIVGQDIDDSSFASLRPRRVQIRAFNMLVPRETSAHPNDYIDIRYPRDNEREQITGSVLTEFVVDTNGKAIMSTFRDLRSTGSPMTEPLDGYYAEFLEAVRDGVSKEYFVPARVGACPVKQIVRLPVEFAPPRGSRSPH